MLVGSVSGKIKKVQRKKLPKTPPKVSFLNIHSLPITSVNVLQFNDLFSSYYYIL